MNNPQDTTRLRLGVMAVVVVALFAALFTRLWYLQVASNVDYSGQAEANRLRVVYEEAPRGRILDRTGRIVVDNEVSIVVTMDNHLVDSMDDGEKAKLADDLAQELTRYGTPITGPDIIKRVQDPRFVPYTNVPIVEGVSEELKLYLEENPTRFPAVAVTRKALRTYPYGTRAAHVFGYVGQIEKTELDKLKGRKKTYKEGDEIGKTGVEASFEDDLRGAPGVRVLEVDRTNNVVRVVRENPPVPGDDIWLTIDLDIQGVAEDALVEGVNAARARPPSRNNPPNRAPAGAIVVQDPRNGEVLAMASYPTYDPAVFVNGISDYDWKLLADEDNGNDLPILNRAIQGQYAPGSTFKLFSAYAADAAGLLNPGDVYNDVGKFVVKDCTGGCTFDNAGKTRYGPINMRTAVTVSSDAYFYRIGNDFWLKRGELGEEGMQEYMREFGVGESSSVALAGARSGRLPTPTIRRQAYEANPDAFETGSWRTGDNINAAIGQGEVLMTPLQLANGYSTFANGGNHYAPNIVLKVTKGGDLTTDVRVQAPRVLNQIVFDPEFFSSMMSGLLGVNGSGSPKGTAFETFRGFPLRTFPVAGKTGTAQVSGINKDGSKKADTAVYSAFGPVLPDRQPEFQVTVLLEEAGFGGKAAAPVARRLFDVFAGVIDKPVVQLGGALSIAIDSTGPIASGGED